FIEIFLNVILNVSAPQIIGSNHKPSPGFGLLAANWHESHESPTLQSFGSCGNTPTFPHWASLISRTRCFFSIRNNWVSQYADFFDFALYTVAGLQVQRLRIIAERRHSRYRACGKHVARGISHGRVMRNDFRHRYGNFTGVRLLPDFSVDAQLHSEIA